MCLNLLSDKQHKGCLKKIVKKLRAIQENNTQLLLDEVLVISGILKVEISVISRAEGQG